MPMAEALKHAWLRTDQALNQRHGTVTPFGTGVDVSSEAVSKHAGSESSARFVDSERSPAPDGEKSHSTARPSGSPAYADAAAEQPVLCARSSLDGICVSLGTGVESDYLQPNGGPATKRKRLSEPSGGLPPTPERTREGSGSNTPRAADGEPSTETDAEAQHDSDDLPGTDMRWTPMSSSTSAWCPRGA
ncbi:hypothetical protein BD413DRAFT_616646 [Trametes elegans]|nr:hypothetical protein BD413DRAFT_616646 [Trametes elegans]